MRRMIDFATKNTKRHKKDGSSAVVAKFAITVMSKEFLKIILSILLIPSKRNYLDRIYGIYRMGFEFVTCENEGMR